jgi:alpha-L-rhamnosidase
VTGSRPHDLRADHLRDPLGIDAAPRLSWKLPAGATAQHAYRVVAGGWDSGRMESAESTFVPVGVAPASGLRVEWRVKVWTDRGESEWSAPASWEHGLVDPSDWVARWVAPVEAGDLPPRQRPAYQLAGAARIDGEVARARLYVTAHGVYEAFVNGTRVGDLELTPGWTAYRQRLQVQAYDVTALLARGDNVVGALLSDGWWRGQNSVSRRVDDYGPTTALLLQLVVTLASGETRTFGTDGTWRSTPSHILRADLVAGARAVRRRCA